MTMFDLFYELFLMKIIVLQTDYLIEKNMLYTVEMD